MYDKYKDDILKLITDNGPMGVNALSKATSIPLSTLQKYLHKQTYFKINEDKKWDLPERVATDIRTNTLELMVNMVETSILLLKSQMEELQHNVDNTLTPIATLKRGLSAQAPVASNQTGQSTIDPRLSEIMDMKATLISIFKKQKANIPDEYESLLFNFDYVGLVLKEGKQYTQSFLEDGLYNLLSGSTDELSEDTVEILKENQLTDKS
jgi:hypothetical protein